MEVEPVVHDGVPIRKLSLSLERVVRDKFKVPLHILVGCDAISKHDSQSVISSLLILIRSHLENLSVTVPHHPRAKGGIGPGCAVDVKYLLVRKAPRAH